MPLISVIMPTYNQRDHIKAALEGLAAQTCKQFELIIVDDGCTDGTTEFLKEEAQLRVPRNNLVLTHKSENQGTAKAINSGAEIARGALWTWVSSDNVMDPRWLDLLSAALQAHPSPLCGVAYGGFDWIKNGRTVTHGSPYDPSRLIKDRNCFFGPAFLMRRDIWRLAGQHRGKISHDYDHWLRVEEVCWRLGYEIEYVPESLCKYYAGDWRVTVRRAHEYDADKWQAEARIRRANYLDDT